MRIVLLCEGTSELALKGALKTFLDEWCEQRGLKRVKIAIKPFEHSPNCKEIQRHLARHGQDPEVAGVIALTDVYPNFPNAGKAKDFLTGCAKDSPYKDIFVAHAAQYEFEAWLLPFWRDICGRLKVSAKEPGANYEQVDDQKPPSHHLKELYSRAWRKYDKVAEATMILKRHPIEKAAESCPELQALLETLRKLCRTSQS